MCKVSCGKGDVFDKIWEYASINLHLIGRMISLKKVIKKYIYVISRRSSKSSNQHKIILQIGIEDFMSIQIQVSLHNHLPTLKRKRSIKDIRRNIVVRTRNSIDDEFCPFLTQILSVPCHFRSRKMYSGGEILHLCKCTIDLE